MTSRRSPPRRSSGNSGRRRLLLFVALIVALILASSIVGAPALAETASGDLKEAREGVTIDWRAGTLAASAGAAADLRMPSVDLARPGAERRARAAALAKLRAGLEALPVGDGKSLDRTLIDRALGRARTIDLQYQSNGGAVIRLEVGFADWLEDPGAPTTALAVHEARLDAAPAATVAGREITLGAAVYRTGKPPAEAAARAARVDHHGRLVIEGGADLAAKLAHGVALIYVQKVSR
ncbi:MAG TPA: hypothetical protein VHG72_06495 [Polyangia bacterium]|nr:hypothetical protein [Polyangia bacterium]